MRKTIRWAAGLLTAAVTLASGVLNAQPYTTSDPISPLPLNPRPDKGGPFFAWEMVYYRMTNPLKDQAIASSGFYNTVAPSAAGFVPRADGTAANFGEFIGQGIPVLDAHQVSGPNKFTPGSRVELGYALPDQSAISFGWTYLFTLNRTAAISFARRPGFPVGNDLADTFSSSPVFNFPNQYTGPQDILGFDAFGNQVQLTADGIWNAASIMTLQFQQKVGIYEVNYRTAPYVETETCKMSGLVGFRHISLWENFLWRTTDLDLAGNADPTDVAPYSNTVSNQMYGPYIGTSWEQYIGKGFGFQLDLGAALMLNIVRERAKYELGQRYSVPQSKQSKTDYTVVPELTGTLYLVWYPMESVTVRFGYNAFGALFNTIASPRPVSFDYGAPIPAYERMPFRSFDGLEFGVGVSF